MWCTSDFNKRSRVFEVPCCVIIAIDGRKTRGGRKAGCCVRGVCSQFTVALVIVIVGLLQSEHAALVESVPSVTGQLADKPTRGQSSRGLVNSRTSQLAEMFDLKFAVYNSSKCYVGQITLFIHVYASSIR